MTVIKSMHLCWAAGRRNATTAAATSRYYLPHFNFPFSLTNEPKTFPNRISHSHMLVIIIVGKWTDSQILHYFQQNSKQDCQRNCQVTSGCNYWTYVSRRERSGLARSCFLYSSKTTQVNKRRRHSGPKFCSSGPPATPRPPVSSKTLAPCRLGWVNLNRKISCPMHQKLL